MEQRESQLKRIQEKLALLLKRHQALQQENEQLKQAIQSARQQAASRDEQIEKLKQQTEVLRYTHAEMSEKDRKDFEKRINTYLKEIDRCIVMLGQ